MAQISKSVRHKAYCLSLGINQLIDRGYSEDCNIISSKISEGKLVDYIINNYKDENINDLTFHEIHNEELLELDKLLPPYHSVIKHYGINNNGLILASSVLAHFLFEEN